MNLTLEDLMTANANGSLESLLLGYGMLPLDVLKFALGEVAPQIEALEDEMDSLLETLANHLYE
ncbi:hypothetical protein AXI76_gp118 [Pseudoalteromonas phage H101]|uniref:Uncharacterized protein n=1 Tax=Pseudoalteromonas phage H101 TaxID=1654919 RepID=A0A0H4IN82_9CAUD|nr:hypothetical protein AXI76_gp118 [Pseudoalteromonas phage H101]AKO61019.1 hypothetical protein [Pseudoalteromonas phage H101]